jgi:hypothetical protein
LIEVARRRRRREDYERWERARAMELRQMDVVERFYLADGTELFALTVFPRPSSLAVAPPPNLRGQGRCSEGRVLTVRSPQHPACYR